MVRHHLLGREGVDAAGHVPLGAGAAPEALENTVLLAVEASLEWAVNIFAGGERLAGTRISARRRCEADVAE